ncbi:MAG: DUF262 domain-containing protein [Pyrinomonadaceae bacterium]
MNTSASNRRLRLLLTALNSGALQPRPEFQRRLVWNNSDKLAFIQTVLEDFPFPEIYIAIGELDSETGEGTELLVDGQQRLTTLNEYFKDSTELKYGMSRYGKEIAPYSTLTEDEKTAFLEYQVVIRDLGKLEAPKVREVFERINSANYALNAMEIHNARYAGAFIETAAKVVENKLFSKMKVFTTNDIRRMQDVRYGAVLVATVMSTYLNLDKGLEDFLEKYNDEFPASAKVARDLRSVLAVIKLMGFEPKSRVWRKADLFTLIVELYRVGFRRSIQIDVNRSESRLKAFYSRVDEEQGDSEDLMIKTYFLSAFQGTNLRANRIRRGEIIQKQLDPNYDIDRKLIGIE